jgi:2-polyprenyl-3-methyl-5-hydroxy-6-metoxy-1,4-benzoquinol methylase
VSAESAALVAGLADLDLARDEREYLDLHAPRYERLLDGLRECVGGLGAAEADLRILDVGPALQTVLIRREYPAATVDTLGYANRRAAPGEGERHIDLDLNRVGEVAMRPKLGPYHAIVVAEVIEHLAVPPRDVFDSLAGWTAPGGWVVVQTPNSLALHKRARALAGRDPLGAARDAGPGSHRTGHFREFTRDELEDLADAAGFDAVRAEIANHFRHPGAARRAYDGLTELLPAGTRQGITLYLRRR